MHTFDNYQRETKRSIFWCITKSRPLSNTRNHTHAQQQPQKKTDTRQRTQVHISTCIIIAIVHMYVRLSASVQDKKQNKTSPHSRSRSVRYYDGSVYDDQPNNQKKRMRRRQKRVAEAPPTACHKCAVVTSEDITILFKLLVWTVSLRAFALYTHTHTHSHTRGTWHARIYSIANGGINNKRETGHYLGIAG